MSNNFRIGGNIPLTTSQEIDQTVEANNVSNSPVENGPLGITDSVETFGTGSFTFYDFQTQAAPSTEAFPVQSADTGRIESSLAGEVILGQVPQFHHGSAPLQDSSNEGSDQDKSDNVKTDGDARLTDESTQKEEGATLGKLQQLDPAERKAVLQQLKDVGLLDAAIMEMSLDQSGALNEQSVNRIAGLVSTILMDAQNDPQMVNFVQQILRDIGNIPDSGGTISGMMEEVNKQLMNSGGDPVK